MTALSDLPAGARERVAAALSEWARADPVLPPAWTLPLSQELVGQYSDAVADFERGLQHSIDGLVDAAGDIGGGAFPRFVELVRQHVALLDGGAGLVASLAAFRPFGVPWSSTVIAGLRRHGEGLARGIVGHGVITRSHDLERITVPTTTTATEGGRSMLSSVFDMDTEPVDDVGRFSVGRVHSHFAYRRAALDSVLRPHLRCLQLPLTEDPLAAITVLGEIASAPDPVIAVRARHWLEHALQSPGSAGTAAAFRDEHLHREAGILQSRRQTARALRAADSGVESEDAAHELAEAYRRVVEGPVRHFLWALTALPGRTWTATPGLASVEDSAEAAGGWLRALARSTVFRPLRNGNAHESLVWEPRSEEFVVAGDRYDVSQIRTAIEIGLSFEAGCEAALVIARVAESPTTGQRLPGADYGIVSRRQQTDAFWGANRLPLSSLQQTGSRIRAVVAGLSVDEVNPALQALLHTRRTWTEFDVYEIGRPGQQEPLVRVTAMALDRAEGPWRFAFERFREMPFSAFLTINLDARSRTETSNAAARAVHWIAIRDLTDAIEVGAKLPPAATQMLLHNRFTLVSIALDACSEQIAPQAIRRHTRLLADVSAATAALAGPPDGVLRRLSESMALQRVAHWERTLGPATLMPGIR